MKKLRLTTLALALGLTGTSGVASAQGICQSGDLTPTIVPAGDIVANTSWSGLVILQGPVFIKGEAILTIAAGAVVRGQPRQLPVVEGETDGTPGALIVTQAGRINAQGSASNPIIFTTAATDNNNDGIADDTVTLDPDTLTYGAGADGLADPWDSGDVFLDDTCNTAPLAPLDKSGVANVQLWGGVVLLGEAPTNNANKCGVGYGKCTIEGLTFPGFPAANATYGGVLPHDNSGVMRFFSIRHAGDELGNGNELNGLSMGGVGDGTIIENGEVYANFDDGFEWFGGTVNGKNLVVSYVGDDMFDADEGYTGVNQFLFGVMPFFNENFVDCDPLVPGNQPCPYGSASGDKAMELDGDNFRPDNVSLNDNVNVRREIAGGVPLVDTTPWPLSGPAFYNATLIGSTPDVGQDFVPVSVASTNRGIQFRNGFAGDVFNTIVVNTGAETGIEVDTSVTAGSPGFNAIDNANNNLLRLVCSTLDDGAAPAAQETTVINNGNTFAVRLGGTAPGSNNAVNLATTSFLIDEDTTFDPTGNAAGKLVSTLKVAPIDPHPAAGGFPPPPTAGCPQTRGTGLDVVTYRGAFAAGSVLWTGSTATNTAWTVLSQSGLMAP
jgi:hypothetical protein